jgi:hypothetical protein
VVDVFVAVRVGVGVRHSRPQLPLQGVGSVARATVAHNTSNTQSTPLSIFTPRSRFPDTNP